MKGPDHEKSLLGHVPPGTLASRACLQTPAGELTPYPAFVNGSSPEGGFGMYRTEGAKGGRSHRPLTHVGNQPSIHYWVSNSPEPIEVVLSGYLSWLLHRRVVVFVLSLSV
ncbi:MAG: hypothetical protein KTR25_09625 [Myxococcales bacterium]|nr:hypothetical protein [Myxococcales bacterium]